VVKEEWVAREDTAAWAVDPAAWAVAQEVWEVDLVAEWEQEEEAVDRKLSECKKGWRNASLFSRKRMFC
jgi:hypothetical protein